MKIDFAKFFKNTSSDKFRGARLNSFNSIFQLKNQLSFSELCKFVDRNPVLQPLQFERIYGNPLPKSYELVGKLNKKANIYIGYSLQIEINWTLLCIRRYAREIALFLEYRNIYESSFLIGDYDTAEKYLSKIETEICCSLWSLENRMLLKEFNESPEAHKMFLSEINKITKGHFVPSLCGFSSNRCERNLAVKRYDSDVQTTIQRIKGPQADGNKDFYNFRLNKYEQTTFNSLKDVLTFDGYHSVVDRYLTLVSILKLKLSDENDDEQLKLFVKNKIQYLIRKFNDNTLLTAFTIANNRINKEQITSFDLKVNDLFASGLYGECLKKLNNVLFENPSTIEYYILYAKCLTYGNLDWNFPESCSNFQIAILRSFYDLLSRNIEPVEAINNIERIIKNLYVFRISEGIHHFLMTETRSVKMWINYSCLALSFNNPDVVDFYKQPSLAYSYLMQLSEINLSSISVSLKKVSFNDFNKIEIAKLNLPDLIKKIELAKFLKRTGDFLEAKRCWLEVLTLVRAIVPLHEIAIENLFKVYLKLKEFDSAISLYVNSYIANAYLTYRIDVREIHTEIRKAKFKSITPSIDLPLFYTFSKADENELHLAYECFNKSLKITRPSQLKTNSFHNDNKKWILFLHLTCTAEIFKHSIFIEGSKDRYSERINVCRFLLEIDKENEQLYRQEINELTDILIIQEGLQQLDESKIYVNESGLINSELKEYEGLFNRYRTIANIYKESNKDVVIFDKKKGLRLGSIEDIKDTIEKEQYSSDPLRDAFADVFDVITRKFLFSKFGISAYLSTRIRHGVLLGEVRPIFEKYNLISQKDNLTNEYRPITAWERDIYYFSDEQKKQFQVTLTRFSETIDTITFKLLKDNLQIKTEDENNEGWFDYYFDDNTLGINAISCKNIKNFPDFVKRVLEILWYRTDKNLDSIRNKILYDVKESFNEAIESLTTNLQSISQHPSTIYTNINLCLTEIQTVLDRISGWFNRTGSKTSDFELDKLITVVLENVSHSYSTRSLKVVRFDVPQLTIKGEYYMHFADLFRIFLDNALKHSDHSVREVEIEILVGIERENLNVVIKNTASNLQSAGDFVDHSNIDINLRKLSTEGKSGFPKADKIIRSDFDNETNFYRFFRDEEGVFSVTLLISLNNLRA